MYENSFTLKKMLAALWKPLQFRGRSTRTELLGYFISFWLITTLFAWLAIGLGAAGVARLSFEPPPFMTIDVFNFLVWLPFPALAVRRFHDQNKSGWWSLPLIISTVLSWLSAESLLSHPVRICTWRILHGCPHSSLLETDGRHEPLRSRSPARS
jgi:uncharacterized membrane protein YhaH (DUF805 family)